MSSLASCFVWNVRGLNGRARRNVVREFVVQERPTLVCIQETKLSDICNTMANEPIRRGFDSLFFLIGWMIWKERNARTFNGVATSAVRLGVMIQEEVDAWCLAGYRQLGALMAIL